MGMSGTLTRMQDSQGQQSSWRWVRGIKDDSQAFGKIHRRSHWLGRKCWKEQKVWAAEVEGRDGVFWFGCTRFKVY